MIPIDDESGANLTIVNTGDHAWAVKTVSSKFIYRQWVLILEVTRQFRRHQMQVLCRQLPLNCVLPKLFIVVREVH